MLRSSNEVSTTDSILEGGHQWRHLCCACTVLQDEYSVHDVSIFLRRETRLNELLRKE